MHMKRVEGFSPYIFLNERQPTAKVQYLQRMIERTARALRDARKVRMTPSSREKREFII
jgi:hypothetical protein